MGYSAGRYIARFLGSDGHDRGRAMLEFVKDRCLRISAEGVGGVSRYDYDLSPALHDPWFRQGLYGYVLDRFSEYKAYHVVAVDEASLPWAFLISDAANRVLAGKDVYRSRSSCTGLVGSDGVFVGYGGEFSSGGIVLVCGVTSDGSDCVRAIEAVRSALRVGVALVLSVVDRNLGALEAVRPLGVPFDCLMSTDDFLLKKDRIIELKREGTLSDHEIASTVHCSVTYVRSTWKKFHTPDGGKVEERTQRTERQEYVALMRSFVPEHEIGSMRASLVARYGTNDPSVDSYLSRWVLREGARRHGLLSQVTFMKATMAAAENLPGEAVEIEG